MRPILITAGATRNPLDAIRYLSAHSTGRTGVWLAERLLPAVPVTLLGSPEACLRAPASVESEIYSSTRDLMTRMERWVRAHPRGVVVHLAAVGDYEATPNSEKIPSGKDELILRLRPTPKIVDQIRGWSSEVRLVSFKAASPESTEQRVMTLARGQALRTQSEVVFANIIGRLNNKCLIVTSTDSSSSSADGGGWFTTRGEALNELAGLILKMALD